MRAIERLNLLALDRLRQQYPNVPDYALARPKYTDRTSNGLTKCIIDWVNLNGYQAERINSMGRPIDQRTTVTDVIGRERVIGSVKWVKGSGRNGTADISATIKGRSVKIEVKCKATGDNVQSEDQKAYQREVERAGGAYFIARTFADFVAWYDRFISRV